MPHENHSACKVTFSENTLDDTHNILHVCNTCMYVRHVHVIILYMYTCVSINLIHSLPEDSAKSLLRNNIRYGCIHLRHGCIHLRHVGHVKHVLMRDEKERRKKQTNNKAKQHSTPKAVTFPRKNELPQAVTFPRKTL